VWERFRTARGGSESHPRNRVGRRASAFVPEREGARSMLLFDVYDDAMPSARRRRPALSVEQRGAYVQVVALVWTRTISAVCPRVSFHTGAA
jgi:hypothetical protein